MGKEEEQNVCVCVYKYIRSTNPRNKRGANWITRQRERRQGVEGVAAEKERDEKGKETKQFFSVFCSICLLLVYGDIILWTEFTAQFVFLILFNTIETCLGGTLCRPTSFYTFISFTTVSALLLRKNITFFNKLEEAHRKSQSQGTHTHGSHQIALIQWTCLNISAIHFGNNIVYVLYRLKERKKNAKRREKWRVEKRKKEDEKRKILKKENPTSVNREVQIDVTELNNSLLSSSSANRNS